MSFESTHEVTELLQKWSAGDRAALDELTPVINAELHCVAKCYINHERFGKVKSVPVLREIVEQIRFVFARS